MGAERRLDRTCGATAVGSVADVIEGRDYARAVQTVVMRRRVGPSIDAINEAIDLLVEAASANLDLDDGDLLERLLNLGVENRLAMRLVVFVPVAFGRTLIDGRGVNTSNTFEVKGDGRNTRRPKRLTDMPEYVLAVDAVSRHRHSEGFNALALRSAEVIAVREISKMTGGPDGATLTPLLTTWEIL